MSALDALLTYQFMKRLVTPFNKMEAYKLGLIDENGKFLKTRKDLNTDAERRALGFFDITVINLKKILAKVPGGGSRFGTLAAALFLVKEQANITEKNMDQKLKLFSENFNNHLVEAIAAPNGKTYFDPKEVFTSDQMDNIMRHPIMKHLKAESGKFLVRPEEGGDEEGEAYAKTYVIGHTGVHDTKIHMQISRGAKVVGAQVHKKVTDPEDGSIEWKHHVDWSIKDKKLPKLVEEVPCNNVSMGNIAGANQDPPKKKKNAVLLKRVQKAIRK